MGTRADFYVGRGEQAEWLGSIAWDGHPDYTPKPICALRSEAGFRRGVEKILTREDSATRPADGWPWPWEDSRLTDYSYAFDDGRVWVSCFAHRWFPADAPEPETDDGFSEGEKVAVFPDMTARQRVTYGKRSGVLLLTLPGKGRVP